MSFEIYEENLPVLSEKIEKINRKAEKFGYPPVGIVEIRRFTKKVKMNPDSLFSHDVYFKMVEVEVVGSAPMIEGWTLAAVVSPVENGANMIRTFPGFEIEIPTEYRSANGNCDHCGKARHRNETFLLWSEADGFKQVGRQCLADFTGNHDPHQAAWAASFLKGIKNIGSDELFEREPAPHYLTRDFISCIIASINTYGWVSRSAAAYGETQSTASTARDLMIPRKDCEKPHAVKVAAEDIEKAEQVISWVRNDLAKRENLSTFDYNMVVSLSDDTISSGMFGFAAYAVVAFDKETEAQIIKNKAGQSSSQHIGKVGDRIQFDNLTVTLSIPLEGHYGTNYFMKFIDPNGNTIVWHSSSANFEVGQSVSGVATVKQHGEYKGVQQTVITRAKFG